MSNRETECCGLSCTDWCGIYLCTCLNPLLGATAAATTIINKTETNKNPKPGLREDRFQIESVTGLSKY